MYFRARDSRRLHKKATNTEVYRDAGFKSGGFSSFRLIGRRGESFFTGSASNRKVGKNKNKQAGEKSKQETRKKKRNGGAKNPLGPKQKKYA